MFPHPVRCKNITKRRPTDHPRYRQPIREMQLRAGQTFQQATQVQTLELCPNQGWSRHTPNKPANTRQGHAFSKSNIQWIAAAPTPAADFIISTFLARRTSAFVTSAFWPAADPKSCPLSAAVGDKADVETTAFSERSTRPRRRCFGLFHVAARIVGLGFAELAHQFFELGIAVRRQRNTNRRVARASSQPTPRASRQLLPPRTPPQ